MAGHRRPYLGSALPCRPLLLQQEHRAPFGGCEPAGGGGEGPVGAPRVAAPAQLGVAQLADDGVRGQGGLGGTDDDRVGAAAHGPGRVRQGVETARLVTGHHTAGTLEVVAYGDLAGAGRVEPGDRLVGADVTRALPPQVLQLALSELPAAGARGRDHAHGVGGGRVGGAPARVVERELGRGQREVGEAVGLDEVGLLDQRGGVEAADLARDLQGVVLAAVPAEARQAARAVGGHLPERLGADAVRGDHAEAGDGRAAVPRIPPAFSHGRPPRVPVPVRTTADWKPPKPLPTDSTVRSVRSRAVRGT